MPKRSSTRKKRPVDVNQLAKSIVDDATILAIIGIRIVFRLTGTPMTGQA